MLLRFLVEYAYNIIPYRMQLFTLLTRDRYV